MQSGYGDPQHLESGTFLLQPLRALEIHQVPRFQLREATYYSKHSRQEEPSVGRGGRSGEQLASSLGRTNKYQNWEQCRCHLAKPPILPSAREEKSLTEK